VTAGPGRPDAGWGSQAPVGVRGGHPRTPSGKYPYVVFRVPLDLTAS
jgi:hypothetical protein